MPMERLQAMIIKNQEEQLELMQQKIACDAGELVDEDPEMIAMKLCVRGSTPINHTLMLLRALLGKRLRDYKAAQAAQLPGGGTASPRLSPAAPPVAPAARASLPTPETSSSSSRTRSSQPRSPRRPTAGPSSDPPESAVLAVLSSDEEDEEDIPLAQRRKSATVARPVPQRRSYQEGQSAQFAGGRQAEEDQHELIPPSSPPVPPQSYRSASATSRISPTAETGPSRPPPRAETSQPRSTPSRGGQQSTTHARAGPVGPPSSPVRVVVPPKPDVKYPWSKEVEGKLKGVFKLPGFRLHQKEAVDATMAGKDGTCLRLPAQDRPN